MINELHRETSDKTLITPLQQRKISSFFTAYLSTQFLFNTAQYDKLEGVAIQLLIALFAAICSIRKFSY